MPEMEKEMARLATRRTLERLKGEEVVSPERYREVFEEESQRLLAGGSEEALELLRIRREMESFGEELYREELTDCRNRRWLYHRKLDGAQRFRERGVLAGLRIRGYATLRDEHGEVAAERVARLFAERIREFLLSVGMEGEMVRYFDHECLLFFGEEWESEADRLLEELAARITVEPFRFRSRRLGVGVDRASTLYAKGAPFYLALDRIEEIFFRKG
jgi:GGDEF domain-containing protein